MFVGFLFATYTIVFVGISADDIATGGLLSSLVSLGIDTGDHFWITSRRDESTDAWAEHAGLQVIRYDSTRDHQGPLTHIVTELRSSRSYDDPAPPPVFDPARSEVVDLPEPKDLALESTERIRQTLAAVAARILVDDSPSLEAIDEYKELTHKYRRAVASSFVIEDPPDNIFFDHEVQGDIASGAFGKVYRAVATDGSLVAIKVLRQEVIQNEDMLQAFRRGVRSMRILRRRNVQGMVAYREAYELPPCTIMDYVRGLNLEDARARSDYLDYWLDPVNITLKVARIVRSAHKLPERVLHRDIRPANVMLRWLEDDPRNWDVVVLDFDLSWHRGAGGKSINIDFGEQLGYLAPEQLDKGSEYSTRNECRFIWTGNDVVFLVNREAPKQ